MPGTVLDIWETISIIFQKCFKIKNVCMRVLKWETEKKEKAFSRDGNTKKAKEAKSLKGDEWWSCGILFSVKRCNLYSNETGFLLRIRYQSWRQFQKCTHVKYVLSNSDITGDFERDSPYWHTINAWLAGCFVLFCFLNQSHQYLLWKCEGWEMYEWVCYVVLPSPTKGLEVSIIFLLLHL